MIDRPRVSLRVQSLINTLKLFFSSRPKPNSQTMFDSSSCQEQAAKPQANRGARRRTSSRRRAQVGRRADEFVDRSTAGGQFWPSCCYDEQAAQERSIAAHTRLPLLQRRRRSRVDRAFKRVSYPIFSPRVIQTVHIFSREMRNEKGLKNQDRPKQDKTPNTVSSCKRRNVWEFASLTIPNPISRDQYDDNSRHESRSANEPSRDDDDNRPQGKRRHPKRRPRTASTGQRRLPTADQQAEERLR